jgi:hypothetical protein
MVMGEVRGLGLQILFATLVSAISFKAQSVRYCNARRLT